MRLARYPAGEKATGKGLNRNATQFTAAIVVAMEHSNHPLVCAALQHGSDRVRVVVHACPRTSR